MALAIGQFQLASTQALPKLKISAQDSALNINHQLINTLHLGQRRLIASIIWIETLMNSDLEHYDPHDLNSWMYQRFNALIELDPKFYEVYRYGGQYLSIVKDDEVGAEDIYRRGLEVFPNDFWLNFNLGFHYYFELFQDDKALVHFEKIAFTPDAASRAPYLASLVTKMKLKDKELSESDYSFIREVYQQHQPDSPVAKRLENLLYAIRCSIDLQCLNSHGSQKCNTHDLSGRQYLFDQTANRFFSAADCTLKINRRR